MSFLSIGMGSSGDAGAYDVDFFAYKAGVPPVNVLQGFSSPRCHLWLLDHNPIAGLMGTTDGRFLGSETPRV